MKTETKDSVCRSREGIWEREIGTRLIATVVRHELRDAWTRRCVDARMRGCVAGVAFGENFCCNSDE